MEYIERINKCTRQIAQTSEDLADVNNSLQNIHRNLGDTIKTIDRFNELMDRLLEVQKMNSQ